jgi:hypothetical protein
MTASTVRKKIEFSKNGLRCWNKSHIKVKIQLFKIFTPTPLSIFGKIIFFSNSVCRGMGEVTSWLRFTQLMLFIGI